MTELDGLIEQLRNAYAVADRTSPGLFKFVSSVSSANGNCICVLTIAADSADARVAAAKALIG